MIEYIRADIQRHGRILEKKATAKEEEYAEDLASL